MRAGVGQKMSACYKTQTSNGQKMFGQKSSKLENVALYV
jgi:hypothetical protein